MSWGRGRRDLDGVAGDLAREEEQRLANAHARLGQRPAVPDDADDAHGARPGLFSVLLGRIRRAFGR